MRQCFSIDGSLFTIIFSLLVMWGVGIPSPPATADDTAMIDRIVTGIESRYQTSGFTAEFEQQSILKAMAVTDTASGRMMVKQPNRMRWEYLAPEPQIIIADGNDLWVFRPEENQVMKGRAPAFFGDGKGAGFLADVRTIRKNFRLFLETSEDPSCYGLRMIPHTAADDLMMVRLDVDKKNFDVRRVITINAYGDETRIDLKNLNLNAVPSDDLFRFRIPPGADVIQMSQ